LGTANSSRARASGFKRRSEVDIDVDVLVHLAIAGAVVAKFGDAEEISGGEELVGLSRSVELIRDHRLGFKGIGAKIIDHRVGFADELGCDQAAVVGNQFDEGWVLLEGVNAGIATPSDLSNFLQLQACGHCTRDAVMGVTKDL